MLEGVIRQRWVLSVLAGLLGSSAVLTTRSRYGLQDGLYRTNIGFASHFSVLNGMSQAFEIEGYYQA